MLINRVLKTILVGFCVLVFAIPALAVDESPAAEQDSKPVPPPTQFVTEHSGVFNGQKINYSVIAGETYLRDEKGEPKASLFTFAYLKKDAGNKRPVTFVWNGGPGSASLWLHMGTFGPRRVSVPSDAGYPVGPPYPVLDAPETILDITDLVFVDPVGTGFSRALGDHEDKEFWGLTEDAHSIAEFIRDWTTAQGRWNTPRFLLGESFGTTRAAAVAKILEGEMRMNVNGIVFVSQALDYAGSSPYINDNLISYVTYLPTMAATAWYHGQIEPAPESLEAFLDQAQTFAVDEYLPALFKGNALGAAERERVAARLAYFTGLSTEYIERANLRINGTRFTKELLRDQGLAVGRLDSRYRRDDMDDLAAEPEGDAADDAISAAFLAVLSEYMRQSLKVAWDRNYNASSGEEINRQWRWRPVPDDEAWEPWPVNTARDLSAAMRINPNLGVLVASGYYDFATPFFDAEYTLGRHDIPAERIEYRYYGAGHMMYVNEPSRTQLLEDVRAFMLEQLQQD